MNAKDTLVINWVSNPLAGFNKDRSQDWVYMGKMRETANPLDQESANYRPNLTHCLFL